MTAVPGDLAPLQVSDVRDDAYWHACKGQSAYCDALRDWLRAHGVDPNDTYRWELYLLDAPFLKVFAYERDEETGRFRYCRDRPEIEKREPYIVPVSTMPPPPPSA